MVLANTNGGAALGATKNANEGPADVAGAPKLQPGQVLAGKYVVERVLGEGGMGTVVAVRHTDLNELRAVKVMRGALARDSEAVERFQREARAAVRLKSLHVARVHDVGRTETGEPYLVMEYLEGQDLGALCEAEPLELERAVGYVLQACEAIEEAHHVGVVHRDLKPKNLFLTRGVKGRPIVKVLDFGISKLMPGAEPGFDMTQTQSFLGSPLYMSPEQMLLAKGVDGRTDIWSLGVVLYELTTATRPFEGASITQLCGRVLQEEPEPPSKRNPKLPAEFDEVVMRCLQKKPEERYATVEELVAALAPFASAGSTRPAAATAPRARPRRDVLGEATASAVSSELAPSRVAKRPAVLLGAVVAIAVVVSAVLWFSAEMGATTPSPRVPRDETSAPRARRKPRERDRAASSPGAHLSVRVVDEEPRPSGEPAASAESTASATVSAAVVALPPPVAPNVGDPYDQPATPAPDPYDEALAAPPPKPDPYDDTPRPAPARAPDPYE